MVLGPFCRWGKLKQWGPKQTFLGGSLLTLMKITCWWGPHIFCKCFLTFPLKQILIVNAISFTPLMGSDWPSEKEIKNEAACLGHSTYSD